MTGYLKKNLGLFFILLVSFIAVLPLFNPGFFPMHDDTQVARVYEMGKALHDGQFPVRWVADLGYGYGYPIFNYYGPLAYYFGGFLVVLGIDPLFATKLMIVVGMLLAGVSMYLLAKSIWGYLAGIVSAVLYMYAPYHALNLYVRGAIGELWAYAFIPFMGWGFYKIYLISTKKEQGWIWKWIAVVSLGYAGVILSHNLTAMVVTPFLLIGICLEFIILLRRHQLPAVRYSLYALFMGLMISAFYWMPAILEMGYTNVRSQIGGGAYFNDHFVCVKQLWSSRWQFGGSIAGCGDGLSFQIGKIHILFVAIAIVLGTFILFVKKQRGFSVGVFLLSLGFFTSVFFTLDASSFIWNQFSPMAFIQYPWRFLTLINFFSALLGGSIIFYAIHFNKTKVNKKIIVFTILVLSLGIMFFYKPLFMPQMIFPITSRDIVNSETLRFKVSKISDEYMPVGFEKPKNKEESVKSPVVSNFQTAQITILEQKTQYLRGTVQTTEKTLVTFQIAHFPSWEFIINNKKEIPVKVQNGYLLGFPSGISTFEAIFKETSLEKIANAISLGGLLLLIAGIIYSRKSRREL